MMRSMAIGRKVAFPLALALAALAASQACDLNPQPIPPEQSTPDATAFTNPGSSSGGANTSGSTSSSGPPSGSGSGSGSVPKNGSSSGGGGGLFGGVSGGSSGATGGDAGAAEDASTGSDAAAPTPEGGLDASDGAPSTDAAGDASPGDAGEDAGGDGGCSMNTDCHASLPDICNICVWPLNHLVCVSGQCVCACRVTDAGGD